MLDAGCGPRVCSLSAVPENTTVIGIDVSHQNIAKSHQKAKSLGYYNFSFIVASMTALPLRDNIFDLTVCIDVMEHIERKHEAVVEISRICKPKGAFVGSTTNVLNPIMQFDTYFPMISKVIVKKFTKDENYERAGRFSLSKLSHTLSDAFFKVSDVKLVGFPPFEPWLYEYSDKKPRWYAYVWILFDKLTKKKPLCMLKEIMVFYAVKK